MVKRGAIITLNFTPQSDHGQAGFRQAVVISNDFFNEKVNMTIVCPITHTNHEFPLHVMLDDRTVTTGVVVCEYIKSIDMKAQPCQYVESIPEDLLEEIISTVFSEIEKP